MKQFIIYSKSKLFVGEIDIFKIHSTLFVGEIDIFKKYANSFDYATSEKEAKKRGHKEYLAYIEENEHCKYSIVLIDIESNTLRFFINWMEENLYYKRDLEKYILRYYPFHKFEI